MNKRHYEERELTGIPICKMRKNFPYTLKFVIEEEEVNCELCQKKLATMKKWNMEKNHY